MRKANQVKAKRKSFSGEYFKGRVALITGGTRGIGRAITLALAQRGAAVVVNFLSNTELADRLGKELRSMNAKYLLVKADVRDYRQVEDMMIKAEKRFGKMHFLINNAGINRDRTLQKMTLAQWEEVIATDLTGVFHCSKSALNHMVLKAGSRIVMISSAVGEMGNFGQTNYSTAKAGLFGLTKSLARELAHYEVTVNAVAPGFTDVGMFREVPARIRTEIIGRIPLKRAAKPEEIAHVVQFLCSEQAGYITGTVIDVNGGIYM